MTRKNTDDTVLIERTQLGETEAFSPLVEKYHSRLYTFLLGKVKNAEVAKDLCQETWLKAFRTIGSFRGDSAFRGTANRGILCLCVDGVGCSGTPRDLCADRKEGLPPSVLAFDVKGVRVALRRVSCETDVFGVHFERLDIFSACIGNDSNAPINRDFRDGDPPDPILAFSIPEFPGCPPILQQRCARVAGCR